MIEFLTDCCPERTFFFLKDNYRVWMNLGRFEFDRYGTRKKKKKLIITMKNKYPFRKNSPRLPILNNYLYRSSRHINFPLNSRLGSCCSLPKPNKFLYVPSTTSKKDRKQGSPQSPSDNQSGSRNPSEEGLEYSNISVVTKDNVKLKGWYIKAKNCESKRVVVFFQGSGKNIGTTLKFLKLYIENTKSEVIQVAYRGYSDSEGSPSENGLKIDVEAILQFAVSYRKWTVPHLNIYVFGRSLGGAVAIHGCSLKQFANQISGIVLENTFSSKLDLVTDFIPVLKLAPFLVTDHWVSKVKIPQIVAPILFVRGLKDNLILPWHMKELMEKATKSQYIADYPIPEGGHGAVWKINWKEYAQTLIDFFAHPQVI